MLRNNVVTVDLGKIRQNYLLQKSLLPRKTEIMPVVKADAYGHGMVPVATGRTGRKFDAGSPAVPPGSCGGPFHPENRPVKQGYPSHRGERGHTRGARCRPSGRRLFRE